MSIPAIKAAATAPISPSRGAPGATGQSSGRFSEVMKQVDIPAPSSPGAARPGSLPGSVLRQLEQGRRSIDEIVRLARTGKTFRPSELLALQAEIYRVEEQFSLVTKAAEQATSSMKRLWQMQI